MTQSPTLVEAVADHLESRLLDLHVGIPARVTAYDASTQKISAQPTIRRAYLDEAGDRQLEDMPVVEDVPVMFPGSGKENGMTFPIAVGDTVWLEFSEASLAQWLRIGGTKTDPLDDRKHALSDAVANPGLNPFSDPIPNVPTDAVVIRAANEVRVGGSSASQHTLYAEIYRNAEDTLLGVLAATLNTIAAATSPPTSAAATAFQNALTSFQSAASTYLTQKVKVL